MHAFMAQKLSKGSGFAEEIVERRRQSFLPGPLARQAIRTP
jgi:hypothetical protein